MSSLLLLAIAGGAQATQVSVYTYSGTIDVVDVDTGTGSLAGNAVGTTFSGSFLYGLSVADSDVLEVDPSGFETLYGFSIYPSSVTVGSAGVNSVSTFVGIADGVPLSADDAGLVNLLLGTAAVAGQPVDVWSADADIAGSMYDLSGELSDGIGWAVSIVDLSATVLASQDFEAVPPGLPQVAGGVFEIQEAIGGVLVYSALGTLDLSVAVYDTAEVSLVPVPAAAWLFASGLLALGWRKKTGASPRPE